MLTKRHPALPLGKSIPNLDEKQQLSSFMEKMLHLQALDVNLFRGFTLPDAPQTVYVFGGQFIGQALVAASKTVDCLKTFHHFQAYFLLGGELDIPVTYHVKHLRDGNSFATRRVDAMQNGNVVFTLLASFQNEQKGFEHQTAVMPSVPPPDQLLSLEELHERPVSDPRIPRSYQNKMAVKEHIPWPIDARFCDPNTSPNRNKFSPSLKYWFRAKGKLPDDESLHRMWFHRPVKADDWILFVIDSPTASDGRGFCVGSMFNQNGEHIVSLVQEGLLREAKPPKTALRAKY